MNDLRAHLVRKRMKRKQGNRLLKIGIILAIFFFAGWNHYISLYFAVDSDQIEQELPTQTEVFISQVSEEAKSIALSYDLYASVMIAQAILESQSGQSSLASPPNYNLFGIKGDYQGQSILLSTQEDDGMGNLGTVDAAFRVYPSYHESLLDYAQILQQEHFWGAHKSYTNSYHEATDALTGVYATDSQYAEKLNALIEQYHLTQYDMP